MDVQPWRVLALCRIRFSAVSARSNSFSRFFVAAGSRRNRPDHLSIFMLGTLVHVSVTGIARDVRLLCMQQLIDLRHVRHIGCRAHLAMHQTRLGIDSDMRFHPEEILVLLLRLMYVGVTLTVFILGRTRRMNDCRIDHRTLAQHQATVAQITVDDLKNPARQVMFFSKRRKLRIVVSSGIRSRFNPANWRRIVVSYRDSSIAGSL